jgi:hypothetical protein
MRRRRPLPVLGVAAAACCVAVGGCSSGSGRSHGGPNMTVCGQSISAAGITPGQSWFVDATGSPPPNSISLPAPSPDAIASGVWIRVSRDCTLGADVSITPNNAAKIDTSVRASGRGFAAVRLLASTNGSAKLHLSQSSGPSTTINLVIGSAPQSPVTPPSTGA